MKYDFVGKDLPRLYKNQQDPLFHYGESWELAEGDGWVARIEACGEIRVYDKDGDRIDVRDLIDKYDTDEKLSRAIRTEEISLGNNNWYEVEFFAERDGGLDYLDIVADDCVCFSFDEAIEVFKNYIEDKDFIEDLRKEIN